MDRIWMKHGWDMDGCYKEPQSLAEKTLHTLLNKKHSVVMIKNDDDSCFARCLAVLLTKAYCVLKQGDSSIEKQGSTRISMETCVALDGVFERLDETIRRRYRHIGDMYQQAVSSSKIQSQLAKAICDFCEHGFVLS